jgi:hypothetical protein
MPDGNPPQQPPPQPITHPRAMQYGWTEWDLPRVKLALRALDAGNFGPASALRDYIRRDPRARGAEDQLADTFLGFKVGLREGPSAHGNSPMEAMRREMLAVFGDDGSATRPRVMREIIEDLAGFAYKPCWLHFESNEDNTRWIPVLTPWPVASLDVGERGEYVALTSGGERVPIGGESWVEFRRVFYTPHRRGAVRCIAESFINRAFAIGDWSIASAGNAPKRIGELPDGIAIGSDQGVRFAADIARMDGPYGGMVHESGAKVSTHKPGELAHKIHMDLGTLCASDYAIAYLGQDGTMSLGTQGTYGARRVLYGVSYDVIKGIGTGVTEGLDEVSRRAARHNYGRSAYPRSKIDIPDLEAEQARAEAIARREPMLKELAQLRSMSTEPLRRELVLVIAERYGQPISEEEVQIWTLPRPQPVAQKEILTPVQ